MHISLLKFVIGWDQSETFVKLYITSIPGVNKINPDEVVKEFTNKYEWIGIELHMA